MHSLTMRTKTQREIIRITQPHLGLFDELSKRVEKPLIPLVMVDEPKPKGCTLGDSFILLGEIENYELEVGEACIARLPDKLTVNDIKIWPEFDAELAASALFAVFTHGHNLGKQIEFPGEGRGFEAFAAAVRSCFYTDTFRRDNEMWYVVPPQT